MGTAHVARQLGLLIAAVAALTLQASAQGSDLAALQKRVEKLEQGVASAAGLKIYDAECASCHGINGDGNGVSAGRFAQHPTDFTKGIYKFQSTLSNAPADDLPLDSDLERSIRQGMSSTEMPPFLGVLSPSGIHAVAQYIKTFSPRFSDPQLPRPETVAAKLPQARPFPPSAESVAAGKLVYKSNSCTDCHGDDGAGNTDEKDKWGFPVRMVSFRIGWFKSGPTDFDLFRSITTGVRGTSMDPYGGTISEDDAWRLVDYVRSFEVKETGPGKWLRFLLADRPSGFDYRDRFPAGR